MSAPPNGHARRWPVTRLCRMLYVAVALLGLPAAVHALGEATSGFPKWEERVIHTWINRARSDPQFEMAACPGNNCGEKACYTPMAPLSHDLALNRAARFHSDEQLRQNYFAHDSACTVVSNINSIYPATCDGSAACACVGGVKACAPTCTTFAPRVSLFGANPSGEIIASPTDPDQAFYLWLFEPSASAACAFSSANGHRFLILRSIGAVGVGVSGPAVGDFGSGNPPAKIPSGSHYPRQSVAVDAWANWYDTAGPSVARINVDGACTAMTRGRGTVQNGAYSATLTGVASGCHRYYFEFKDSANQAVTYPSTGSLGIGPAGSCADWDATRPTSCDALPQFTLSVGLAGTGSGSVASMPAGIVCGADCSEPYISGTLVTLTATPSGGSLFSGWTGGGCTGTGTCVVTIAAATSVAATFAAFTAPDAPTLLGATPGNGQVTVTFSPPVFDGGSPVTIYTALCAGMPTAFNTGLASPITVTGMINGQSYACGVTATNLIGNSTTSGLILVTPNTGTPLALTRVTSRKLHGVPPPFDLPVDFTRPVGGAISVEPRFIGAGHTIVFQFNSAIFSTGSVSAVDSVSGPIVGMTALASGNEVLVILPGVPDIRRVTITLTNVNGVGVNAMASIGFLVGDVNSSRAVIANDISGVKARSVQAVNATNFRFDLNTSGTINSSDIAAAKARSGRVLP
ncbi:MAG: hypothetical protein ABI790_08335 [Betaproteobacteria bacterium]